MTGHVRIGELARRLRVHPQTLLRWEREGRITSLRGPGPGKGVRYYSREEVERIVRWRTPRQAREVSREGDER